MKVHPTLPKLTRKAHSRTSTRGEGTRAAILHLLCRNRDVSRIDIAHSLEMDLSTISVAIKKLMEEGIVCERGAMRAGRGRPKTRLAIAQAIVVCGAHISASGVSAALVDLSGRVLALDQTPNFPGFAELPALLTLMLRRMEIETRVVRIEGLGITISEDLCRMGECSGMARSAASPALSLKRALEAETGLWVEVENELFANAVGESIFGSLAGVENALVVQVADSIGAAIISNGKLHTGTGGLAGRIGHLTVAPGGAPCSCGKRGCLEAVVSSRAVLEDYRASGGQLMESCQIGEFFERVAEGEPLARRVFARQVEFLANGLSMLLQVLAPQVVVFTGPITRVWHLAEPMFRSELDRHGSSLEGVSIRRESTLEPMRTLSAAAIVLGRHHRYSLNP